MKQHKQSPKFFAGHSTEDEVSGGGGDTIEDAILDYTQEYMQDELGWLYDYEEGGWMEFDIKVCRTITGEKAKSMLEEEGVDDCGQWEYILGEEVFIKTILVKYIESDHEFITKEK